MHVEAVSGGGSGGSIQISMLKPPSLWGQHYHKFVPTELFPISLVLDPGERI